MKRMINMGIRIGICLFCLLGSLNYLRYYHQLPAHILVEKGGKRQIELHLPAKGIIELSGNSEIEKKEKKQSKEFMEVFLENPVTFLGGDENASVKMSVSLYGILPLKEVSIDVVEQNRVYVVGEPYGFYLKTDGILVVGIGKFKNEQEQEVCPAKNHLQVGDRIVAVNGCRINYKKELVELVEESKGNPISITYLRSKKEENTEIIPERTKEGEEKLGIWVRDNAQGVGTITYMESDRTFGALGHPITDMDTNEILPIENGTLYDAQILSIEKGTKLRVGEVIGLIDYAEKNKKGALYYNNKRGIFGKCNVDLVDTDNETLVEIALKQEIQKGTAYIKSTISGTTDYYEIEILEYHLGDFSNRAITFRVKDEKLIELTGGIIQGMSGSPILQNGKLIGAVTHVFVDDPRMGYGIFAQDMMGR